MSVFSVQLESSEVHDILVISSDAIQHFKLDREVDSRMKTVIKFESTFNENVIRTILCRIMMMRLQTTLYLIFGAYTLILAERGKPFACSKNF